MRVDSEFWNSILNPEKSIDFNDFQEKAKMKANSIVMSLIHKNEIINFEEVYLGIQRSTCTITCISLEGSAYFIPAAEILNRI